MTQLRIQHRTKYTYQRPVEFGRHRLVLRPREGHDVRVQEMKLEITPEHQLTWSRDVFGNSVALVDFTESATVLEVLSDVLVHRTAPFARPIPDKAFQIPYPVSYDPLEAAIAAAYQLPIYASDGEEIKRWLDAELLGGTYEHVGEMVVALCVLVHKHVKYQRRERKGVQTPAQTLGLQSGSCRDMATLMMEAARLLGIAARFASGYLDCLAAEAGHASMHAWTEIYYPLLGWIGYDPTLGTATSLRHVLAGVSNHPRGVMPISGMFTGAASDYLDMSVEVKIDKV